MAGDDRRIREQPTDVGRRGDLARVRAQLLQVGGEHPVGAQLSLDAHGRGDIGQPQQAVQVRQGEHQLAEHAVGAVDQGQPFLLREGDGRQAVRVQGVGGGHQPIGGVAHVSFAHHRQGDVGQWGQIPGAAQAAVLVDHRRESGRQQVGVGLRRLPADPGAAAGQRGEPQEHHGANHLALDLGPRARSVRTNQAALQLLSHFLRDVTGGQRAEPGRNAVHRTGVGGQRLDVDPAGLDGRDGGVGEFDGGAIAGDRDDVGEADRPDPDDDCHPRDVRTRSARRGCRHRRYCLVSQTTPQHAQPDERANSCESSPPERRSRYQSANQPSGARPDNARVS